MCVRPVEAIDVSYLPVTAHAQERAVEITKPPVGMLNVGSSASLVQFGAEELLAEGAARLSQYPTGEAPVQKLDMVLAREALQHGSQAPRILTQAFGKHFRGRNASLTQD